MDDPHVSNKEGFDLFLNDAVHSIQNDWQDRGGRPLDTDETYDLSELLDNFFSDKRADTP